ncbi:MAG: J domain-containing protein [Burkholderiales bacterium]
MNHYEALEVSRTASQAVIRAAYRSLMQHYHPDKNPDNKAAGDRAALIVQAYEVLSDDAKRAAYDLQLAPQSTDNAQSRVVAPREFVRQSHLDYSRARSAEKSYGWIGWLLIALILVVGITLFAFRKKPPLPEIELSEIRLSVEGGQLSHQQMVEKLTRQEELLKAHPHLMAAERQKGEADRILPNLLLELKFDLKFEVSETAFVQPVLRIPVLGAKVGSFDAKKMIAKLQGDKELIRSKIATSVAKIGREDLIRNNGALLQETILNVIGEVTGTSRFENFPPTIAENPSRYGVVEIILPKSFSVSND